MTEPPRVLLVATHPIQYQVPWFQGLAKVDTIDFSVLFIQIPDAGQQGTGFDVPFNWDIPLLEGYHWQLASDVHGRGGLSGFFATRLGHPTRLLRDLKPDVVVVTGWQAWPLLHVLLAARRLSVPVIMRGESNALRERPWLARLLHKSLLAQCAAFLAIGKANRDFYRGYGVPEEKVFDAAYFVDNARFIESAARLEPSRNELRAAWCIPSDATCYCFAGKLQPKKRILDLLAALRLATQQTELPLHLLVVGTGEQMPQAQAFVAQHGLPVTFAGFLNQSEIPSAYVAADCMVLPSDYGETWGLVVNEAMACGRTAIVSDRVGCSPDLITEGETGAMFPFGDVDALAKKMQDMSADPGRVREMGANACQRVLSSYSVEKAVAGTLSAVRYACGQA